MSNTTVFSDHVVKHAGHFRNAQMVVECEGAFSLTTNGPCHRCGYPTVTVAPSCHVRYVGSDGQDHLCTRPSGHDGYCRAGDYT